MKQEKRMWKNVEFVIFKIVSQYMSGGAEENHKETLVRVTAVGSEGRGIYLITNTKKSREIFSNV